MKFKFLIYFLLVGTGALTLFSLKGAKINAKNWSDKVGNSLFVLCETKKPCTPKEFDHASGKLIPLFTSIELQKKVNFKYGPDTLLQELPKQEWNTWIRPEKKYQINPLAEDNGLIMGHRFLKLLKDSND